jgi:DNA-binding transcriptional LysR family regulator
MASIRRSVTSLSALATFEAAARLGSFTRAGQELGVTQAAVSRQIKTLESDLGAALFVREHRRVDLTPAGATLAQAMSGAFGQIAEAIDTIRRPAQARVVTLGATLGFAHFWLLPRLAQFRAVHPKVQLRLVSQDQPFDLRRDPLDVLIHYGVPGAGATTPRAVLRDEVFPVAAPSVLRASPEMGLSLALDRLPLIGAEWIEPSWLTWRKWAVLAGVQPPRAEGDLRFNHYTDAIQAAINGEGLALGWARLIAPLIEDGRLQRLPGPAVVPSECHCLIVPDQNPRPAVQAVADWIARAFAQDT